MTFRILLACRKAGNIGALHKPLLAPMQTISLEQIKPDLLGGLYIAITSNGEVVVKGFGDNLQSHHVEALSDKLMELSNKVRKLEPS